MITRVNNTMSLYAANKIYDGNDGFIIGYTGSSSVSSSGLDAQWINAIEAELGISISPIVVATQPYTCFRGSFQELRYYNTPLTQDIFHDFTMNPYSIEGVGINGAYDQLMFRAPLGNDLYTSSLSIHPKITGSSITQSFSNGTSAWTFDSNINFISNKEFIFQDQIPAGIKNTISKKIKNVSTV